MYNLISRFGRWLCRAGQYLQTIQPPMGIGTTVYIDDSLLNFKNIMIPILKELGFDLVEDYRVANVIFFSDANPILNYLSLDQILRTHIVRSGDIINYNLVYIFAYRLGFPEIIADINLDDEYTAFIITTLLNDVFRRKSSEADIQERLNKLYI